MISNLNGSGSVRVHRKKAGFTGSRFRFGFGSTPCKLRFLNYLAKDRLVKKSLSIVTFLSSVTCLVAFIITFSKLRGSRSVFWFFPVYIQKGKFILNVEEGDGGR